jgi:hypothetical protein
MCEITIDNHITSLIINSLTKQVSNKHKGSSMKDATLEATKKTLSTAHKAFVKYPSATNWRALEAAMLDYQASHQISLAETRYSTVIAQADRLINIMST